MSLESVKKWFDSLQATLQREAELAGILDHGSMVGTAREFFVKRVLSTILPPAIHVGTGKVIGGKEEQPSKQVDVVIYDSRCPFLEIQPGMGLYFIEGVIATIEVKSTLDADKLREGLENCRSVMEIPVHVAEAVDLKNWVDKAEVAGLSHLDATQFLRRNASPRTYIFAFSSKLSTKGICEKVSDWYDEHGQFTHSLNPFLPSVIAVPGAVGLQEESWLRPNDNLPNSVRTKILENHGSDGRIVMRLLDDLHHFGWLAIHLIHTIQDRLGLRNEFDGVRRSIVDHLPGNEYFREMKPTHLYSVVWSGSAKKP